MPPFFQQSALRRIAVHSVHNEYTTKTKRQATDFSFVVTKAGLFPLLPCTELLLRLLLRAHQHDKDNWENAALFYKG